MYFKVIVSLFTLLNLQTAFAADYTIHHEYTSTRALGMGDAFIAVADDHSGLFYNPASLALRKDGAVHAFLRAGIDADYPDFIDEIEAAEGDSNEMANVLERNFGEHRYSRVPTLGAMWVRPNWGMAFIPADLSVDIGLQRSLGPSIEVHAYLDTSLAWGYAKKTKIFKKHPFAWGFTLRALHRAYYSDIISAATLAVDDEIFKIDKAREGMTIDADIGFLWAPPVDGWMRKNFKPTFAAVVRNVGDYGFPIQFDVFNEDNPQEPPDLQRRLDIGSKFDLRKFWVFDPKLAVDVRDIFHDNWTIEKGAHVGLEAYWKMFNWWKGHWSVGMNQMYWTAGFGAKLAWFQLDIATWGEEVGTSDAPNESRRYMAELSIDF